MFPNVAPPATNPQPRLTSRIRLFDDYERKPSRIPDLRHEKRRIHAGPRAPFRSAEGDRMVIPCVPGAPTAPIRALFPPRWGGKPTLANETGRFAVPDGSASLLHEQDSPDIRPLRRPCPHPAVRALPRARLCAGPVSPLSSSVF